MKRRCKSCNEYFSPRNSRQHYCTKDDCQRKRKSIWQKRKLTSDPDYRQNQADAQELWRSKHPEYMRAYRKRHPEYVERNRHLQAERRQRNDAWRPLLPNPADGVVKMDASNRQLRVIAGTYKLVPIDVVKMDVITVQLSILEEVT
jgi:hypothetical protein